MKKPLSLFLLTLFLTIFASDEVTNPQPSLSNPVSDVILDQISIPLALNYQGKLTDLVGNPVRDSSYSVTFRLFTTPTGGTAFWTETKTIWTRAGLFNTLLGDITPIPSIPLDGSCYLEMQVNPNPPMTPRIRIVSSAYSYLARKADSANYAASAPLTRPITPPITTGEITDGAVNSAKILDGSVRGVDIAKPCTIVATVAPPLAPLMIRNDGTGDGLRVMRAGDDGVSVDTAGWGVYVSRAGVSGVLAYGNVAGGRFLADTAAAEGLYAHAYGNVAADTAIQAYGRGYATGGWFTGGLLGDKEAPCIISPELGIIASGTGRLVFGKAEISFDPLITENIRTDIPIRITVTPRGKPAGILYVSKSDQRGFTVELEPIPALEKNEMDVTFDWIAFATLKEYETSPKAKAEWEKMMREREEKRTKRERMRQERPMREER